MMKSGLEVRGLEVKNTWLNFNNSGIIEEILDLKINEPGKLGQSLIDYYIYRNQSYRVNKFTEEDKNANVILVRNKKISLDCIPQALTPIITTKFIILILMLSLDVTLIFVLLLMVFFVSNL